MKLASIFFTASESIFEVYLKYLANKRARNMKLASIFFTASENIFEVYLKYLANKRARNCASEWVKYYFYTQPVM